MGSADLTLGSYLCSDSETLVGSFFPSLLTEVHLDFSFLPSCSGENYLKSVTNPLFYPDEHPVGVLRPKSKEKMLGATV